MRTCFLLALTFCAVNAADPWKSVSCRNVLDSLIDSKGYDKSYDVVYPYVVKQLEGKYPGSKFQDVLGCQKAERQVVDAKKIQYRVDYKVSCDTEAAGANPKKFVCVDTNDKHVGDVSVAVSFEATCAKGVDKKSDCMPNNVAMKVTKGPGKPTPTPTNKWVPTSKEGLPESVQKAATKKIFEVTPLKRGGPMRTPDTEAVVIPSYDITRKEDGKGAVAYRVPAFTFTKSLAGNACPYPFLLQRVQVEVNMDRAGRITFPKNPVVFRKAEMSDGTDPELEERRKCIGQDAWKKAVAKGKKFLKTVPKNQGGS